MLYSEAELFAAEELPDAGSYLSVVAAIAQGASRQSESASVRVLRRSRFLPTSTSFVAFTWSSTCGRTALQSHPGLGSWQLSDGYIRFWFRFVRPNSTDLEARRTRQVARGRVMPALDQFVSRPAFEDACREHVRSRLGIDAEYPESAGVGAWWGQIPDERHPGTKRTRSGEVEIVAYQGKRLLLAGEAKWSDGDVDLDALRQLEGTVRFVPGYGPWTRLAVYARDGFTDRARRRAREEGVILRTVDDLYA